MDRIVNKARTHKEAEDWDLLQQIEMTCDQRHEIAKALKERFFGIDNPDVRESRAFGKRLRLDK